MEIQETIKKWFEETAHKITTEIKTNKPVDNLVSGIIPLAKNYSDSVFLLLNKDRKLPAMALLRVLSELTLRLIWCLFTTNDSEETVDIRIERWLKDSYAERKAYLDKLLPVYEGNDRISLEKEIQYLKSEIGKIPYEFPGGKNGKKGTFYKSLDELSAQEKTGKPLSFKKDLYPILYSKFNTAIHLDLLVLSKLIKQDGNVQVFLGDLDKVDCEELRIYCMSCVFNIISLTRAYYDWDYTKIKEEFLKAKRNFEK